MCIGVFKEIKVCEYCVGLMLNLVVELVGYGYEVVVEIIVGLGIGCLD